MSGTFKKDTNVQIVLHKNLITNYYDVPISKKPYTALCVDILQEEETEKGLNITKYINEDGLSGEYSIYVLIDDILYDTDLKVTF